MLKQEIGLRIKKLREERHLTKEAFAKQLGISGQYLGIVERGQNCLSVDKLKKLCDITHQSSDYILFGKEYKFDSSIKEVLANFSDDDIKIYCEALEKLALIMNKNMSLNQDVENDENININMEKEA